MTTDTATKEKRPRRRAEPGTDVTAGAALPPTKTRRRPLLIAAGVALAVVGGLGSWYFFTTVGNTETVLVVKNDVPRGQQVTAADLTTMQIAGGQSTDAVPASQSGTTIGQLALVDLPAGSLVTSENVGKSLVVADGKSIVGVAFTSAQMPSQPLAAGDKVRLVDTPIAQGDPPAVPPQTYTATVFTAQKDQQNNRWIVDLIVTREQAPEIAATAATGRVALILDAGE